MNSVLYYIIDTYTHEVMDVASTPRLRDEKYNALVEETGGLFIWQTIEARNRAELDKKLLAVHQKDDEQDPFSVYFSQRTPVNYSLENRCDYYRCSHD